ncbi:hypothetical protein [Dermatophilus congolensis]|uniref:Integral membrane protein n=1 Tax=Dermatophilus congolensis TaxID=1863 RepID=A0A239VBX6_9MICO|nr:hypothetical protein [Dermatophilus congolensis]MBO3128519.1 hypothetical protein [Dermatophilus congolensis]MBO3132845.1 hypothetical protein [Dermatophilus congolensis]MBO3132996.1 hypothetical protein [Dermatophilus congolensis]MBO3135232.1 hypothetical protein [Dermatophilus congolensis]MBO3137470.1 hypothetical protein [Dermatophilus congolensis]
MATTFTVLGLMHWLGLLLILVGWAMSFAARRIHVLMVWGARLQLLIGLGLVGVLEMSGGTVNHMMVGIKLLVAVAVVGLCEASNAKAKRGQDSFTLAHAALGLTLVNTVIGLGFMG